MYLVQSARKRVSSACFSWSTRFSMNVRCCMTALFTWLFRKSVPLSMGSSVDETGRRCTSWASQRLDQGSGVVVNDATTKSEEGGDEADSAFRRALLDRVEKGALESTAGL